MLIDYSEFNSAHLATTKLTQYTHPDGTVHLEIDCLLPPGSESLAEIIYQRLTVLMKSLPQTTLVSSETWTGEEAQQHDIPAMDYHHSIKRDPSHEN
jgi:hypothetical protein